MLDIGFSELLVIGGVALVVLGPEKLAVVARSTGKWAGKAQRYVNDVKADIAREGELAELRKLKDEMETTGRDIGSSLRHVETSVQQDLTALENTVKADASMPTSTDTAASHSDSLGHLSDEQAQASIQASLDGLGTSYNPPTIDMTGKYQSGLDATLSEPPLNSPPINDPIVLRMEYEALHDDLHRLENRMTQLKQDIAKGLEPVSV
jgi:Tat protein translocase TatB subunit